MSLEKEVHDLVQENLRVIENLVIKLEGEIGAGEDNSAKAKKVFSELAGELKELDEKVKRIGDKL